MIDFVRKSMRSLKTRELPRWLTSAWKPRIWEWSIPLTSVLIDIDMNCRLLCKWFLQVSKIVAGDTQIPGNVSRCNLLLVTWLLGESPSSSASDVDNVNHPAGGADKAGNSRGISSPLVAGNHVISAQNRFNILRLLQFVSLINASCKFTFATSYT